MKTQKEYTPDWISEEDACKWLGVDRVTLFRWRTKLKLNWTNINKRTVMYDKKQLNSILNQNSTYAVTGEKQLPCLP